MKVQWSDEFYLRVYELARSGMPDGRIAKTLGISTRMFQSWVKRKPALLEALERGRGIKKRESFSEFVFGRLPGSLKDLWGELQDIDTREDRDFLSEEIELLFEGRGKFARQQLFIYALIAGNFNMTEARRKVGINPGTFNQWKMEPQFAELMQQVHECKKDYFESALMGLVGQGDVAAVIFANKTVNKDRGYVERQEHAIAGTVTHRHTMDELPLEVKREVLKAIEQKESGKLEDKREIIEGEYDV